MMDYRNFYRHAEHRLAAKHFLDLAKSTEEGRFYSYRAVIIFSAFYLEAFVNHASSEVVKDFSSWDENSKPSINEKLEKLGVTLTEDHKACFSEIFDLRNILAHSHSVTVSKKVRKPANNGKLAFENLKDDFESRTTPEKVETIYSKSLEIIESINSQTLKLTRHELGSIGNGSYRVGT